MASKVMASSSPAASDLNRPSIAIAELQTPDASRSSMNMDDLIKGYWPADPTPAAAPGFAAEVGGTVPKTAEQVWKEIDERRGCDGGERVGEMTLEDFLAKAGLVRDEEVAGGGGSGGFGAAAAGAFGGATSGDESFRRRFGFGEEVEGAARAKRKAAAAAAALSEPVDRAAQQRQRRMIKNRESAARSRERKLAYTMDLQSTVSQLEEENAQLVREQMEQKQRRYKQWLAARVGVFYFSINKAANGSISHCQMGHKFAVVVRRRMPAKFHSRSARLPPFHAPYPRHHRRKSSNNASSLARAPTISPTSQIFPPCRDGFCSSPSPAPTPLPAVPDSVAGVPPSLVPTLPVVPDSAGGVPSLVPMPSGAQDSYGVPFVTSNPALPLPEGETDSSTIRPLPTSAVEGRVLHWSGTQMLLMVLLLCLSFTL
ncbi:unnamed protein product [Victoria cruziana]